MLERPGNGILGCVVKMIMLTGGFESAVKCGIISVVSAGKFSRFVN